MLRITGTILLLLHIGDARPTNRTRERTCRVGNVSFPVSIFESYAGWECYEEIYAGMKRLTVHVCVEGAEDGDYTVPCFRWYERMLSFNLKNEESVAAILNTSGSKELNDEMIRCYLSVVTACETSPGGWFGFHGGCRFFVGNTTENMCALEGQSKFHIAMLSISLIIGIPAAIIFFYCTAATGSEVLSHSRNLITALIMRTLFSLLIETEVISVILELKGEPLVNWSGCEALASFETITLNLVLAFWLILTFHLFESSKSHFEKEPEIKRGVYIVLGLSLTFPVIWMIIMGAGSYGNCWLERTPVQWVNDSLRLGYILLQIVLAAVMCLRIVTDIRGPVNDQTRFKVRVAIMALLLSPLFLLQFSLSASHTDEEAHIYAEFFFDGLQCGIVSSVVVYIAVTSLVGIMPILPNKKCHIVLDTMGGTEVELRRGGEPPRVGKHPLRSTDEEERRDVTYSSVITAERFERTIKLYNRLNVIPKQEAPVAEEVPPDNSSVKSEYFDIDNDSVNTVCNDVVNQPDIKHRYYSSKYLVHDTESSGSEESVIEVTPWVAQRVPSTSSSSGTLPRGEVDTSRDIEEWLANCRCEFEDYAERSIKSKSARPPQHAIHRSLSGSILTECEIPGSVRVELRGPRKSESVRAKKGSAPSMMPSEEEEYLTGKKPEELPSIYDDLKAYNRQKPKTGRKRNYNAEWCSYRNRVLDKRRKVKSLDDLDPPRHDGGDGLGHQLGELLTPSSEGDAAPFASLQKAHFGKVEDLTLVGDNEVGGTTEKEQKSRFADSTLSCDISGVEV